MTNLLRNAQSALEYLMIIGITLGIIVPTTYFFFRYSSESTVQIVDAQITQIGRIITNTAESVYYSGESSKIILEVNMPESVTNVQILSNRELVFSISSEFVDTEAIFFTSTSIPITSIPGGCPVVVGIVTCDIPELAGFGLKRIRIQAIDDGSGGIEVLIENV